MALEKSFDCRRSRVDRWLLTTGRGILRVTRCATPPEGASARTVRLDGPSMNARSCHDGLANGTPLTSHDARRILAVYWP